MIDRSESRLLELEQRNRLRAEAKRHLRLAQPAVANAQPGADSSPAGKRSIRKRTPARSVTPVGNSTPVYGLVVPDVVG